MNTGRTSRVLSQPYPDTVEQAIRLGRYGEGFDIPLHGPKHAFADEGSFFVCTNPAPGTGIVTTTSITAFAETDGAVGVVMLLKNLSAKGDPNAKRLYLDYIKLLVTAVPTSATNWGYALTIDDNPVRWTSGGSPIYPVNPNGDSGAASRMMRKARAATVTAIQKPSWRAGRLAGGAVV